MKLIPKILIVAFLLSVCNPFNNDIKAQNTTVNSPYYKTGIGVRLGGMTSGLTVKSFINPSSALEGIFGFGRDAFSITGLYEKHVPIVNAEGLQWLYGGGAHIGFFRYGGRYYYWTYYTDHGTVYYVREPGASAAVAGFDFIIGLDYKFRNAPFNVGL